MMTRYFVVLLSLVCLSATGQENRDLKFSKEFYYNKEYKAVDSSNKEKIYGMTISFSENDTYYIHQFGHDICSFNMLSGNWEIKDSVIILYYYTLLLKYLDVKNDSVHSRIKIEDEFLLLRIGSLYSKYMKFIQVHPDTGWSRY
ncbi:MAG: hypothetical protein Kapaf2KO_15840 [Candidatus Kapaibacteriales bacterium]